MRSSLGKLRKFALPKTLPKEKKDHLALRHLDGLAQASQDMMEMRNCYDSLLSAAAAMANSAYEFSESLLEMGNCLQGKIAIDGYEECDEAVSMLGRTQLELQKLVDSYRSHIILTITNPSESLLSELRKVEEMKLQCDEKREVYDFMVERVRSGKGESLTSEELQAAREEHDDMARLCIFRVESLKQGQCRSLLTQAARHHAAQLNFFQKGLKSLEAVEPKLKMVAEKQHIDYQHSGFDDGEDGDDEGEKSYETNDDGELSFDYRQKGQEFDNATSSRNEMELDHTDAPGTQSSGMSDMEINSSKHIVDQVYSWQQRTGSHSAPLYAEKSDQAERFKVTQPSEWKYHSYALPTPADTKSTGRTSSSFLNSSSTSNSGNASNLWHSSPLDAETHRKVTNDGTSMHNTQKYQHTARERTNSNQSVPLPLPASEGISSVSLDVNTGFDAKKFKRLAFSGPLTSKSSSGKPFSTTSGPTGSTELPQAVSGLLSQTQATPPPVHLSQSSSPPLASSPRISELHELPRPPGSLATPAIYSGKIGHSAPLVNRNREVSPTNRSPILASNAGSPLPLPPLTVPRSFSIPSSNQRTITMHVAKLMDSPRAKKSVEVASPPLTPISLSNRKSVSAVPDVASRAGQI